MKARWIVAKYMPDLRRREPVNVGLLLQVEGQKLSRFAGQGPGGVDGRKVRSLVQDVQSYKAWVEHWQRQLAKAEPDDLPKLALQRRPGDSFFLEPGGEVLAMPEPRPAEEFLDELYRMLVDKPQEDDAEQPDRGDLAEAVFEQLRISRQVKRKVPVDVLLASGGGLFDRHTFDYRYDNGVSTVMRTMTLGQWDRVHSAAFSFRAVREKMDFKTVAMIVQPERPGDETAWQVGLLKEHAEIVDLTNVEVAAQQLGGLLNIH